MAKQSTQSQPQAQSSESKAEKSTLKISGEARFYLAQLVDSLPVAKGFAAMRSRQRCHDLLAEGWVAGNEGRRLAEIFSESFELPITKAEREALLEFLKLVVANDQIAGSAKVAILRLIDSEFPGVQFDG